MNGDHQGPMGTKGHLDLVNQLEGCRDKYSDMQLRTVLFNRLVPTPRLHKICMERVVGGQPRGWETATENHKSIGPLSTQTGGCRLPVAACDERSYNSEELNGLDRDARDCKRSV